MEQTCARCGNKVKIYPGSINACGDFANCPWGGITPLVDTQTPRSTPLKLVIHKLDNGGYIVSDVLNEFGGAKPVFASARLGEALSYVGMEMDPPPVTAVPVAAACDAAKPVPSPQWAGYAAAFAPKPGNPRPGSSRLDAAARSIADASLLLDAALNTLSHGCGCSATRCCRAHVPD